VTRVWKTSGRSLFTIVEARNLKSRIGATGGLRDVDGRSAAY